MRYLEIVCDFPPVIIAVKTAYKKKSSVTFTDSVGLSPVSARTPASRHPAGLFTSTAVRPSRRPADDDDVASVSASISALSTGEIADLFLTSL